jgi:hypothetical protein
MRVTLDAGKYVYFVDFMADCISLTKRTKSTFSLLKPHLFIFKKWWVFFHVSFPPNNFEPVEGLPRYDMSATLDAISSLWFGLSLSVATHWAIEILSQIRAKDCPLSQRSN